MKIWFQNRRMKWKRSKKTAQETKQNLSSSSSKSSSTATAKNNRSGNTVSTTMATMNQDSSDGRMSASDNDYDSDNSNPVHYSDDENNPNIDGRITKSLSANGGSSSSSSTVTVGDRSSTPLSLFKTLKSSHENQVIIEHHSHPHNLHNPVMPLWIECGRYANRHSPGETIDIGKVTTLSGKNSGNVNHSGNHVVGNNTSTGSHHLHGTGTIGSVEPFYRQFVS